MKIYDILTNAVMKKVNSRKVIGIKGDEMITLLNITEQYKNILSILRLESSSKYKKLVSLQQKIIHSCNHICNDV